MRPPQLIAKRLFLAGSVSSVAFQFYDSAVSKYPAMAQRRTNPRSVLKHVAITGGTHGNERNGVLLAQALKDDPGLTAREHIDRVTVMHTNVAAMAANLRYVDEDMNRCFSLEKLAAGPSGTLETQRAVSHLISSAHITDLCPCAVHTRLTLFKCIPILTCAFLSLSSFLCAC